MTFSKRQTNYFKAVLEGLILPFDNQEITFPALSMLWGIINTTSADKKERP